MNFKIEIVSAVKIFKRIVIMHLCTFFYQGNTEFKLHPLLAISNKCSFSDFNWVDSIIISGQDPL